LHQLLPCCSRSTSSQGTEHSCRLASHRHWVFPSSPSFLSKQRLIHKANLKTNPPTLRKRTKHYQTLQSLASSRYLSLNRWLYLSCNLLESVCWREGGFSGAPEERLRNITLGVRVFQAFFVLSLSLSVLSLNLFSLLCSDAFFCSPWHRISSDSSGCELQPVRCVCRKKTACRKKECQWSLNPRFGGTDALPTEGRLWVAAIWSDDDSLLSQRTLATSGDSPVTNHKKASQRKRAWVWGILTWGFCCCGWCSVLV
jgi:hypothetical protein